MTDTIDHGEDADEAGELPFKTLTKEEAQALLAKNPPLSPWRVISMQVVVGLAMALLWWGLSRRGGAAWSALYGAAAVVLPGALMARGITKQLSGASPVAAAARFLLWELLKIMLAGAMLVAAARVVPDLSWPALLVTMIVCMKVNWLVLLLQGRKKNPAPL